TQSGRGYDEKVKRWWNNSMREIEELKIELSRRHFLSRSATGLGIAAMASLLDADQVARADQPSAQDGLPGLPHFAPRAKRVIYLFQSGAPSQLDLFDYKQRLIDWHGADLPASVRQGQRLTSMTSRQEHFPVASSMFRFAQHGASGAWLSELLPHTARVADE